jgi:hypothetical protein
MSVDLAMQQLTGPRGGNLDNPRQQPEARRAPLNTKPVEGQPGLHTFRDTAQKGVLDEKPWHRMAAYMLLSGRTNSEIALAAGVEASWVSNLRAQRWFQELLAVIANDNGQAMKGLVDSEAQAAFNRIVEIAQDEEVGARVRLAANQLIVEHSMGKPTQKIISHSTHSVSRTPADEMAEIQQELDALRRRNDTQ